MIELVNLNKTYKTKKGITIEAIKNLSLKFDDNGLVFVVGKSGSGKSTLLNLIGLLDSFDSGEIIIDNQPILKISKKELDDYRNYNLGFVFQEYNLIESYTVYKNIELVLDLQNETNKEEKIKKVIHDVELDGYENSKVNRLSGGQKQRVAIARALVKNPKVILCDEPTGSLDSKTGKTIFDLLQKISKDTLVIVVTHDVESAYTFGNRVISIKDGMISSDENIKSIDKINKSSKNDVKKSGHLTFKNKVLLAFSYLLKKPLRLCVALIISIISLLVSSTSYSFGTINSTDLIVNSMQKNNFSYYSYYKTANKQQNNYYEAINMNEDDVAFLKSNLKADIVNPVYDYSLLSDTNDVPNVYQTESINESYYPYGIQGFIEVNEKLLNDSHLSYVGNLPANDNEIMISRYLASLYQRYNYLGDNKQQIIINLENMINKTLKISDKNYKIVGLVDTKFDDKKYDVLFQDEISDGLYKEVEHATKYGLHNVLFFNSGFYKNNFESKTITDSLISLKDNTMMNAKYLNSELETLFNFNINSFEKVNNNYKVFYKNNADSIDKKSFVPLSIFNVQQTYETTMNDRIDNYINEHYEQIKDKLITHFNSSIENELKEKYKDYIKTSTFGMYNTNVSLDNEIEPGITCYHFEEDLLQNYLNNNLDFYNKANTISLSSDFIKSIDVAGIVYDSYLTDNHTVYVNDSLFDELSQIIKLTYADISFVLIPRPNSKKENKLFVSFTDKKIKSGNITVNNESYKSFSYSIDNEIVYQANKTVDKFNNLLKTISMIVCIIFVIFSIIFINYHFLGVIQDRKKEIGILRSLGISKREIVEIFILEGLYILLSTIVIVVLLFLLLILMLNNIFKTSSSLLTNLFSLSFNHILLIIGISILSLIIGIIVPLIKISSKKPIDLIKERS